MKKYLFITTLFSVLALASASQDQTAPTGAASQIVKNLVALKPNIEFFTGFMPDPEYLAFKTGVAYNNFVLKRMGAYTNVEFGKDGYFAQLYGISGSVSRLFYIYAGLDLYTSHGMFKHGLDGCRKEIGVSISPYPWACIRLGYSFHAGPTFGAGYRMPL